MTQIRVETQGGEILTSPPLPLMLHLLKLWDNIRKKVI